MAAKRDNYQMITDQILEGLEKIANGEESKPSWVRPWSLIGAPRNAMSNRPYRGLNSIILSFRMAAMNWDDGRFATYKAIQKAGGQVRKGEKGTLITLWKFLKDKNDPDKTIPLLRTFTVFNVKAQADGIELKEVELPNKDERDAELEGVFKSFGGTVKHQGNRACYIPARDEIHMPQFEAFKSGDDYYSTLAHEYVHWTGHKDRLDRNLSNTYDKKEYAFEELVAELGNAFICQELGIDGKFQDNHLAYVASWVKCLSDNNRAIFRASSLANAAVKSLLGQNETEDETSESVTPS
jgi:antirestriction protein ArdC